MKSILEYEGNQVEIEVPDTIVSESKWLDDNVHTDLPEGEYEARYNKQQEWYENQAKGLFDNADLFMEAFMQQTPNMKKMKIVDYAVFIDF